MASFVQPLEHHNEEETDKAGGCDSETHEVVFLEELGIALDASVLHEEIVSWIAAKLVSVRSSVHIALTEIQQMALLGNTLGKGVSNTAAVRLANVIFVVIHASVGNAAHFFTVYAVFKDLANCAVRARNSHFAEADWRADALNARVTKIANHAICVSNPWILSIIVTSPEVHHRRDKHQGEENKRPYHYIQNVNVRDDTVAETLQWVLLILILDFILLLLISAFHDFPASNFNGALDFLAVK